MCSTNRPELTSKLWGGIPGPDAELGIDLTSYPVNSHEATISI